MPFKDIIREEVNAPGRRSAQGQGRVHGGIIDRSCRSPTRTCRRYSGRSKQKTPGGRRPVLDFRLRPCKGCGECVQVCGDHDALRMTRETEELNAELTTAQIFSRLLPDTPQKFLGLYNDQDAAGSREAALRNHLMVRRNYEALVSGDGACAGCGEKSILRACASVTEAYMRPIYHRKADRLSGKASAAEDRGCSRSSRRSRRAARPEYRPVPQDLRPRVMGLGGENDADTAKRIAAYEAEHGAITDEQIVDGLAAVIEQDAFNHKDLQSVDGRRANGMSRHDDGRQHGLQHGLWLHAAVQSPSLSVDEFAVPGWRDDFVAHGRVASSWTTPAARSCPSAWPTPCSTAPTGVASEAEYFTLTHLDDALMTEQEIRELPKVWVIGGDGALGDIGFQNVSKVILQNRPEREDAHARHPGVFEHRRAELRLLDDAGRLRHEPVRHRLAGKADREEERRRGLHERARIALRRAGVDGQRGQAVQGDVRRSRVPRHGLLPGLHDLPARARRRRTT